MDSVVGSQSEITGLLFLAQPFTENFGKRMTKSPKIYFSDTGLVCHLLGLRSAAELARSPFSGPIFENHVACEIAKAQQHHGRRRELYFLRDKTGVEVDFALPLGGRRLALVEAKTTRTTPARPIPSPPRSWDSTRGPSMLAH